MRRVLITLVLLIPAALVAIGGLFAGIEVADRRWVADLNRLGDTIQRLDADIKSGAVPTRDATYYLNLSEELILERFDDKSVTYYAGPYERHPVTIEFDESGVTRVQVQQ